VKYLIRFNKSRGQPGRGTMEHVWRVFEDEKEYLVKHFELQVPSKSEQTGGDWNVACSGKMVLNRETSTAIIIPDTEQED
jgi:hypothetical protein